MQFSFYHINKWTVYTSNCERAGNDEVNVISGVFSHKTLGVFSIFVLQHKQQERVKQVRANREALFKLASDLETFMIWNDAERTEGHQQHQARQLANDIADGFDRLSQRYSRDLQRAEGFSSILWESKKL